ncbi:hypothetical protein ACHQM5_023278 [Ranunculus cassubicifolius]
MNLYDFLFPFLNLSHSFIYRNKGYVKGLGFKRSRPSNFTSCTTASSSVGGGSTATSAAPTSQQAAQEMVTALCTDQNLLHQLQQALLVLIKLKRIIREKSKDAERRGDEATLNRLEKAYDKVMMAQLSNRKKGLTFGSFQVSKDIKYADKQPIVPWGPRFTKSSADDTRINMAISALFTVWIVIKREAEWKPLQFLAFVFVYRIFEKLKSFEPQVSSTFNEEGEDEGRGWRMGSRSLTWSNRTHMVAILIPHILELVILASPTFVYTTTRFFLFIFKIFIFFMFLELFLH